MSKSTDTLPTAKSVRHQQVLDIAADNPDASLQQIAEEIPSATAELVERVLDKYGDPADDDSHVDTDSPDPMTDTTSPPDRTELTEKELQTLRVIHEQPDATQREVAELLGVSGATISNRVNGIEGFDWGDRTRFTAAVFDEPSDDPTSPETSQGEPTVVPDGATETAGNPDTDDADTSTEPDAAPTPQADDSRDRTTVDQLSDRLTAIEAKLEAVERADHTESVFADPELAHKVLHACFDSDAISEDEELQLLRTALE